MFCCRNLKSMTSYHLLKIGRKTFSLLATRSFLVILFRFFFWLLFRFITEIVFNWFQWNFQRLFDISVPQVVNICITMLLSFRRFVISKFSTSHFVRSLFRKRFKKVDWNFLGLYIYHVASVIRLEMKNCHFGRNRRWV